MGWNIEEEDKIARLRAYKKNKGNVYELVLRNKKQERIKLLDKYIKTIRKNLNKNINRKPEVKLPAITYGKVTPIYVELNALRQAY